MNELSIRKADNNDLQLLYKICRQCYSENFADHWNPGGLEFYLDKVYGIEPIKSDLSNTYINYFIVFAKDEPIGFMKLHLNSNLPDRLSQEGLEIEKIYFLRKYQGKGLGKKLISKAFDLAQQLQKKIVWLAVLDTNESSIQFYTKLGFVQHSKTSVDLPYFKEELKGMWRMMKSV